MKTIGVLLLAALVAACAVPGPREPDRFFVLDAGQAKEAKARPGVPVVVAATSSSRFYDTQDIAFSRAPGQRAYYQFNRWTERPHRAIQAVLEARLGGSPGQGDWILGAQLVEIYHDATEVPGTARITVTAQLVARASGTLVARRTFTRTAPAASHDAPGAVRGFNEALALLVGDIEAWVAAETGAGAPR
jgi:ABC-type uncharacterized transport system auxiliary subunit